MLRENLARVHQRIRQACEGVGRDPASVTLIAVTKGLPLQTIREAAALGITDVGENRVQEARIKQTVLGSRLKVEGEVLEPRTLNLERLTWHLIGHLQRNKANDAVELFGVIHSVDSLALADELERQAAKQTQGPRLKTQGKDVKPLEVFVQVNVSGETTKFGCRPEETPVLVRTITQREHLRLRGLMTIAPFVENPEAARPCFRQLRHLRDELNRQLPVTNYQLQLSMGMSHDFEVAIEEGADLVRIGTAIFGPRANP